ncbi:MAG TPA: AMP-binding protein [Alphaproteobacteria bacterium]
MIPNSAAIAAAAGRATVGGLLRDRAQSQPDRIAVEDRRRSWTYRELNRRVNRLAHALAARGIGRGDRVAILSENRAEYLELEFAAAKLGAIVPALNWRLGADELDYCVALTTPKAALVSPRHAAALAALDARPATVVELGEPYEAMLAAAPETEPVEVADPEDGLVILYTSGTTGRPKGAVVSQRAFISRVLVFCADYGIGRDELFPAWAPMFHMASTDLAIGTLLIGGRVALIDGFDLDHIAEVLAGHPVGWLILMPGVIDRLLERHRAAPLAVKGVRMTGAMADLVPRHVIAEVTRALAAPYLNSFGATETGIPPASGALIPPGEVPERLSKRQSSMCELRLVDEADNDVPDGTPGEVAIRGPTLFSGYWNAPEANARDFRGGWFHMGDVFVRNADGSLDFVDRAKYLIKTGGENVYPAEIEQVLLADPRVADAVVVRRADARWGEVPVAVVARRDDSLGADELMARCRERLAGYKRPKEIRFVALDELPRSTTGKIQRHEIEARLAAEDAG